MGHSKVRKGAGVSVTPQGRCTAALARRHGHSGMQAKLPPAPFAAQLLICRVSPEAAVAPPDLADDAAHDAAAVQAFAMAGSGGQQQHQPDFMSA